MPIVACCDLRFAGGRGIVHDVVLAPRAGGGMGQQLDPAAPDRAGHALDLLFSARKIDAEEATRIGLVNRVVPTASCCRSRATTSQDLAANCSPTSIMIMKRQVYQHLTETLGHAEKEAVR